MNPGSNADDIGHRFIHFLERPEPIVDIGKRARGMTPAPTVPAAGR